MPATLLCFHLFWPNAGKLSHRVTMTPQPHYRNIGSPWSFTYKYAYVTTTAAIAGIKEWLTKSEASEHNLESLLHLFMWIPLSRDWTVGVCVGVDQLQRSRSWNRNSKVVQKDTTQRLLVPFHWYSMVRPREEQFNRVSSIHLPTHPHVVFHMLSPQSSISP